MRVIDLFAGMGGMSLGFQQAGYTIVAAYDHWKPAIDVYRENFNHPIYETDLAQFNYEEIGAFHPDMIIGGPPCQDFSSAGKRDESGGRADLTIVFAKIVTTIKPTWFVMENVDRIQKSKTLRNIKAIFSEADYGFTETILNASLCGVPQLRKRYFLIGRLGGKNNELAPYLTKNQSSKPLTVAEYCGDEVSTEFYYRHPRNYSRRAIYSIYEPSATIRGVNRPIPKGYKGHPSDPTTSIERVRPLTTRERSIIQTFSPDFKLVGTKSNLEQMIGNAVPVKLAEFV
ncbi:MAG: DNA cytosine methyltransferase, partial [Anaerolineae bacterium]|nr:DNA cytosine methyltransferase [Anaerolineae bacterium]